MTPPSKLRPRRAEHSPMRALYGGRFGSKLIGYVCGHCGAGFTPAGNPSESQRQVGSNPHVASRYVRSKVHAERVRASRKRKRRVKTKRAA